MTDTITVAAKDVRIGDLVDLEGDTYADPRHDHAALASLYQTVCEVERETETCVAIGFEGFDLVGFPPDHPMKVLRPPAAE